MSTPVKEEYIDGETWILYNSASKKYYACTLETGVEVESYYIDVNGKKTPSSWRVTYEGTEFLIFAFSPNEERRSATVLRSYDRKQQLLNFISYEYPYIPDSYGIYQICKDGANERVVLLQNLGEDELADCEIMLNQPYETVELLGAEGILKEDRIILTTIVQPFASVAMVLKKGGD